MSHDPYHQPSVGFEFTLNGILIVCAGARSGEGQYYLGHRQYGGQSGQIEPAQPNSTDSVVPSDPQISISLLVSSRADYSKLFTCFPQAASYSGRNPPLLFLFFFLFILFFLPFFPLSLCSPAAFNSPPPTPALQ